jgi:dihydrofolate synthase/folylpolyglutamate synthase
VSDNLKPALFSGKERFDEIERRILGVASPGIRPGLSRMARLCSLLGNPERTFPAVHVLGTNGKGSVCAAIDSILRESGFRTACYTSPHLEHMGERLTFDGRILPATVWEESVDCVVEAIRSDSALSADPPSVFEILTATAFLCIARGNRDIAVIEAGLGGRLDATNLLGDVKMTVFTAIGKDHEDILGHGIKAIAREKFSALRPRIPAVSMANGAVLDKMVVEKAQRLSSPLCLLERDATVDLHWIGIQGSSFTLFRSGCAPLRLSTPLLGSHQVANAALAALACLGLSQNWRKISEECIRLGLERTKWPGRCESIPLDPIVLLDGAHNPQGAETLSKNLLSLWPGIRPTFVMAAMKDKDILGMLEPLSRTQGDLFCTEVEGLERCETAPKLAEKALSIPWPGTVRVFRNSRDAIREAMMTAPFVVCTGSLYFIGSIRRFLIDQVADEKGPR